MNYFGVGLAAGVLTGIIVFIIATVLGRKSGTCTSRQYDERQLALRSKAFRAGFFTLLISLCSVAILDVMEVRWCEAPLDKFFCIFLSIMVFACTAILKDAYFGLGERKKTMLSLFTLVALLQFFITFTNYQEGTLIVDGILTLKCVSPGCGIIFLVILLTVLIQHFRNARKLEDEE
ncbi:MAG: hypothetical protein PUC06_11135 [Oscillospiraceae bacterium]|nr:hypothetical protein [Oscillospiraceae bacterium]